MLNLLGIGPDVFYGLIIYLVLGIIVENIILRFLNKKKEEKCRSYKFLFLIDRLFN